MSNDLDAFNRLLVESIHAGLVAEQSDLTLEQFILYLDKSISAEFDPLNPALALGKEWSTYYDIYTLIDRVGVRLEGLTFQPVDKKQERDYEQLLALFPKLTFVECSFYIESLLKDEDAPVRFIECRFFKDWILSSSTAPVDDWVLFDQCQFLQTVTICGEHLPERTLLNYRGVFRDCTINSLSILGSVIDFKLFDNSELAPPLINHLAIQDSVFKTKFSLANAPEMVSISLLSSVFEKKFALINCRSEKLAVVDTNFLDLADFFESHFLNVRFKKSKFHEFAGFEDCHFGDPDSSTGKIELKYVTFYSFMNFRKAHFYQPLDLRNTNRKEVPNFLDARFHSQAKENTDRETFRIIKHSFDSVGNHIDANEYYALEMEAYRKELADKGWSLERVLLWFNYITSRHGQNYVWPILWIAVALGILAGLRYAHSANWLYQIYEPLNQYIGGLTSAFNWLADQLFVAKPLMIEGIQFLSLIIAVIIGALVWQALVAFRRHGNR